VRRAALACGLALAAVAGCGKSVALPDACRAAGSGAVQSALARAPAGVRLTGGTPISDCVARARSDAELQTVGASLTDAGDRLAREASRAPAAATRLGYLEGATERGASRNNGIGAELGNRMAHLFSPAEATAAARAAYERGRAAGRAGG
jgi:hypothetical protein